MKSNNPIIILTKKINEGIPLRINHLYINKETRSVNIDVNIMGASISFEDMTRLSELFQTKKINTSDFYHSSGGCSTCGYGDELTATIDIMEIPKKVLDNLLEM